MTLMAVSYTHLFNDEENLKRWLLRVCINLCKNNLKSYWKRNVSVFEEKFYQLENSDLKLQELEMCIRDRGWVAKKRNLGSLVFIDLRDRYGITQIVLNEEMEALGKDIKNRCV